MKSPAELKQIVLDYCVSRGWPPTEINAEEVLLYGDAVYERREGSHRWWNDVFRVVNVGGTLIGCVGAETTGDSGARETGWVFDWNSLCEVKRKEVVTTIYERLDSGD
jgi:hypothetical protein